MATDQQFQQQAQQLANQALAPVLAEIERQKQEEAKRAALAQQTATAGASGLAQVLGGIAPQVQQDYKQAGDSTSAYAKGFSAAFTEGSNAVASDLNAFLQKQGSPQQVQAAGEAGGDVLYGTGGFIPGSALAREGAGFTAAARMLPGSALRSGQEQVGQIRRESGTNLEKLNALLRQEKAKLPGLTQQFRQQAIENRRADRGLELQEREFEFRQEEARRPQSQIFGSGETGYMTFDPRTGRVVRLTDPAPAGAEPPELIGSSDSGYYSWNAGTGELTPVLAPPAKPKYTPTEIKEFKKDAYAMAYDAFWGIKTKEGDYTQKPMQYQEALAWMMKSQQIPLEIAQNALNGFWKKPGFAVDAEQRMAGKVYYFKPTQAGVTGRPLKPIQERKPQGEPVPVDPAAEASANQYGGTTVPNSKQIPGWNDKNIPPKLKNALAIAHAQIGKPYVWGAESPAEGGFDCSGLIEYAFEQAGIPTPGRLTTWSMMQLGKPVKGQPKPGDWIITNGGKHVVMYVGKGQVIAAPRRGEVVQYQPLSRFKGSIVAIRRYP